MKKNSLLAIVILFGYTSNAQQKLSADTVRFKTVSAGPQYKRTAFFQALWGRNYRKEWTQAVNFPVMYLDTLKGGLISYKEGGSNQSKSLHLTTIGEKEYTLRSVDKSLNKVIPAIFQKTFVADLVNDEVSMSNPYGALAVPVIANAAGINHTVPKYYYLPRQKALDTLNDKYAGKVYLFEQRPKGNWSNADNLGNFKDFADADEMLEKILEDHNYSVDQQSFVRARLIDMLIGDFDRHFDQWKYGIKKQGDKTILIPVPTDRDQAFSTHNGLLLNLVIRMANMKFIQPFNGDINNLNGLATINRLMDRLLTNKLTLSQWQSIASELQRSLTDDVIEASVKQMPPEIFQIRGEELIGYLKSRRNELMKYATKYYELMADESEVVGTKGSEYFEINNLEGNKTEVKIFPLAKDGKKGTEPFYNRTFNENETDELRIYGLAGNDVYSINGKFNDKIKLRIIGGIDRDSIIDATMDAGRARIEVYDNKDNYFQPDKNLRLHISEDSSIHVYNYNSFQQDKKGFAPHLIYNDYDRIFLGIRYQKLNYRWRKKPFAYKQSIDVDYSISQKAFSTTYNGLFPSLVGQWDLITKANYDWVRWINFHGLGNETPNITNDRDYYRMRTEEASANLGLNLLSRKHHVLITGFYQRVKIINDTARFINKSIGSSSPAIYDADNFAGLQAGYDFAAVKDSVLPQSGITFSLNAKHTQNLKSSASSFQTFAGNIQFFIPLVPKFSLAIKTGATTILGKPLFYQYPSIGESYDLRGYRRERFSGKSTFYNNTELRFISKVRTYIFNGQAGLMAFMDNGRVWMPGENSNKFHTSFGGGILLAPFNLTSVAVTYGISNEIKMFQIRVGKLF
ncbi:MAG: hypothetical protein ABIW38_14265 [Ferruginibacter sp.]